MTASHLALERALELSEQILRLADGADFRALAALDGERIQLLKSFKREGRPMASSDAALLAQIMALNDRAVGVLEHRKRGKGREMDVAAVGRRAVAAYGHVRMQR